MFPFSTHSRRRRRFAKYFRFLVSFSRLEFVVALFSTTTTAASESQPQPAAAEKSSIRKAGFNIQHLHTCERRGCCAREEINELTNTRAKVTRQNIYKMPLNSWNCLLQQSSAAAEKICFGYNRPTDQRTHENARKKISGNLSLIKIHILQTPDDVGGSEMETTTTPS